jgi:cytochrome c biogenesis protein CcmG/thiol:disulfide interchange protein DsbE
VRPVTALAASLLLGAAGCTQPIQIGSRAPDFDAVDLATGHTVTLGKDYLGKVTLVNIWATWCEPCREEIPALDSLNRALSDKGFRVVAVSIDAGEPSEVKEFMQQFDVSFDVLHDRDGRIQKVYHTRGVPESFLIDRDGRIRRIVYGAHPWASVANRRIVTALLGSEESGS